MVYLTDREEQFLRVLAKQYRQGKPRVERSLIDKLKLSEEEYRIMIGQLIHAGAVEKRVTRMKGSKLGYTEIIITPKAEQLVRERDYGVVEEKLREAYRLREELYEMCDKVGSESFGWKLVTVALLIIIFWMLVHFGTEGW